MTMTAPEHVHDWPTAVVAGTRFLTATRCTCGLTWDEWLRETCG